MTGMQSATPPELQSLVRQTYSALMKAHGGAPRRGQQQMIGAIANAVACSKKVGKEGSGERILAVNAPVGCGKSFSYGVGAVPIALANGLRVVISTSNVALQAQLIERDLVSLAAVVPGMSVAGVKGRHRMACPAKMAQAVTEGGSAEVAELLAQLESGSWSGDADELKSPPKAQVWAQCTNDRRGCSGTKCPKIKQCPYYINRTKVSSANVLVTNHAMLLSDARSGFSVLPAPEDCVYVVDEAHDLPARAVSSLAGSHAIEEAQEFAIRCGKAIGDVRRLSNGGECGKLAEGVAAALSAMAGALSEAESAIASTGRATQSRDEGRPVRFPGGRLPEWLESAATNCVEAGETALKQAGELLVALNGDDGDRLDAPVRSKLVAEVGHAASRLEVVVSVWKLMRTRASGSTPVAKWVEICPETRDLRVCASPLGVSEYLHETIWSKAAAVVHLSGTLNSVGGMEPYLRDSGLALTPGMRTMSVESPFDHARQAKLIVPRMVSPKDVEGHTKWLVENVPQMIRDNGDGNGTLVLFASLRQLRDVADAMPEWVQSILFAQDRMTKREVIARHTAAVKAGRSSVIFGSSSYEEGLDLPRELCTLVVVSKLPFSVPTDPVSVELRDHLEANGKSYFDEVALPKACRRLTQLSGRLIRTEQDYGAVVVADPRLVETKYGRAMLACLPPFAVSRELSLSH